MGKILWQPRKVSSKDRTLADELGTFFSKSERYILSRYHAFRAKNPEVQSHLIAGLLLVAQMIHGECRHSYVATYVRTVKKLARMNGHSLDAIKLEIAAKNIEFAGRCDAAAPQSSLSLNGKRAYLLPHPSEHIRLIAESMTLTSFRLSDVTASGVHILDESDDGFLIKLHGGQNHRSARKVDRVTVYKRQASEALVRKLQSLRRHPSAPFTTVTCRAFSDAISEWVGHRVTSRAVRNLVLHRILEDAFDTDMGAVNYAKAALSTRHHITSKSLKSYHTRVVGRAC